MKLKSYFLLLSITLINIALKAQNDIKPMMCEGEMPRDLTMDITSISKNENKTNFSKRNLLSIQELFATGQIVYGNESWKYLNKVGNKILIANNIKRQVSFYLLRSTSYNAFATDEGYIIVTTSLLAQVASEEELAFILSHELSHILLQHSLSKTMKSQERLKGKKEITKKQSEKKKLTTLNQIINEIYRYNRNTEFQADSLGLIMFKKAGFQGELSIKALSSLKSSFPIFDYSAYDSRFYFEDQNKSSFDSSFYLMLTQNGLDSIPSIKTSLFVDSIKLDNSRFRDSISQEWRKKIKDLNESWKKYNTKFNSEGDSLNLATHPELGERIRRLKKYLGKTKKYKAENIIPVEVKVECLKELLINLMQQQEFSTTLALLPILYDIDSSLRFKDEWKGIVLSAFLIKEYKAYFEGDIGFKKTDNIYLKKLNWQFSKKIFYDLFKLAEKLNSNAMPHYYSNLNEYYSSSSKYYSSPFKFKDKSLSSSIWSFKKNSSSVFLPIEKSLMKDKVGNPMVYKMVASDNLIVNLPIYDIVYTKQTKRRYLKKIGKVQKKKSWFVNELKYQSTRQSIKTYDLNFFDKSKLTTKRYNQIYKNNQLMLEILELQSRDRLFCPIYTKYAQELKEETNCSISQFIYLFHNQRKNLIRPASILMEAFIMYGSGFIHFDQSGFLVGSSVTTITANLLIDLETYNIKHVGYFGSGLTLQTGNLSAIANWIAYDSKRALVKK